jgi:hypothetical protein
MITKSKTFGGFGPVKLGRMIVASPFPKGARINGAPSRSRTNFDWLT